jgi:hypothetical protein
MSEPWRGIQAERYHLLVKIRKDPHALTEHMDFVEDFARRAIAHGVRSAEHHAGELQFEASKDQLAHLIEEGATQ